MFVGVEWLHLGSCRVTFQWVLFLSRFIRVRDINTFQWQHALVLPGQLYSAGAMGCRRDANLRGARLIGADLSRADLSLADLTGADLRAADLRGADLASCLFLTQAQLDAAEGDTGTRLPPPLTRPAHWPGRRLA